MRGSIVRSIQSTTIKSRVRFPEACCVFEQGALLHFAVVLIDRIHWAHHLNLTICDFCNRSSPLILQCWSSQNLAYAAQIRGRPSKYELNSATVVDSSFPLNSFKEVSTSSLSVRVHWIALFPTIFLTHNL